MSLQWQLERFVDFDTGKARVKVWDRFIRWDNNAQRFQIRYEWEANWSRLDLADWVYHHALGPTWTKELLAALSWLVAHEQHGVRNSIGQSTAL